MPAMPASIVLTGLAANDPLPGIYVQINFAQGPATGSGVKRAILVLANKTSAGTATANTTLYGPDTQVPLQSEDDMIALGGPGSEAHRMFRRIAKINKVTPVYWLFVAPSAGTAASGTIVLATTAGANGNHRTWVGDEFVDTAIATGQTATQIGDAIVLSINAMTHWPVTAVNVTGTVTLTAKVPGPRGNWIRFMAAISGAGVATTTSATTDGFLTSGATADSNTTALATILAKRNYYIVSAAEDATQLGALVSQVGTQALPTNGIRQRVFAGCVDTLANAITVATGINSARCEIVWAEKSPYTPAELAAHNAAIYALEEANENNPRTNFIGYGNTDATAASWYVPAPRVASAAPSKPSLRSALNNGLTPVGVNDVGGSTYLVNRITTRSLNGATADYRIRPAHKVTICDFFADAVQTKMTLQNAGCRIGDDPVDGQPPPGPKVRFPKTVRMQVYGVLEQFNDNDLLQPGRLAAQKAATQVQRETNPPTRMSVRVPLEPIDNFESAGILVEQVA
jgi:phage tail sheath gpL-like